jgi:transposase
MGARRPRATTVSGFHGPIEEMGGGEDILSWIDQNRRLSKDYERLPKSSEAFVYVAMSRLMARRLARL